MSSKRQHDEGPNNSEAAWKLPSSRPMRCKPVTALPAGEDWTFEIKFDGYRCIAVKRGREVTVFSRHRKVLNRRFPSVVQALVSLESDFVLDGELVALDLQGRPSFQILQNNLSRTLPVYFYCFDLLNRNGETLVSSPIERRRDCGRCGSHNRRGPFVTGMKAAKLVPLSLDVF
jgi:ATP-dependent DNA ligase